MKLSFTSNSRLTQNICRKLLFDYDDTISGEKNEYMTMDNDKKKNYLYQSKHVLQLLIGPFQ